MQPASTPTYTYTHARTHARSYFHDGDCDRGIVLPGAESKADDIEACHEMCKSNRGVFGDCGYFTFSATATIVKSKKTVNCLGCVSVHETEHVHRSLGCARAHPSHVWQRQLPPPAPCASLTVLAMAVCRVLACAAQVLHLQRLRRLCQERAPCCIQQVCPSCNHGRWCEATPATTTNLVPACACDSLPHSHVHAMSPLATHASPFLFP